MPDHDGEHQVGFGTGLRELVGGQRRVGGLHRREVKQSTSDGGRLTSRSSRWPGGRTWLETHGGLRNLDFLHIFSLCHNTVNYTNAAS